jgi:hypothetical protein
MPRLSTLSNPTGLVELDKKRLDIQTDTTGNHLAFSLVRLDLADLGIPGNTQVIVIARRGNTEERVEVGPLASWNKGFHPLPELGEDGSLVFRVLLAAPNSPKLIAAAEHIRPSAQGDSESFIALEPADLEELPWEVEVHEQEGRATIRFNREIFQSSAEAESNAFFMNLILPEAIRAMARSVATDPGILAQDEWQPFKTWLAVHGVIDEPDEDSTIEEQDEWCRQVAHAFCHRFTFTTKLKELRLKDQGHDD